MRITGGTHRGRRLDMKVARGVRPTGSRVREALFNMLGNQLDHASVLDATGGSGILAFEAASRGACPVLVHDKDRRVIGRLRAAVIELGFEGRVEARWSDSLRPPKEPRSFAVVLADPPYAQELEPWVAALLPQALQVLVLEHASDKTPPEAPDGVDLDTRRYGGTALSFYRRR